jgi:hypothetical protein
VRQNVSGARPLTGRSSDGSLASAPDAARGGRSGPGARGPSVCEFLNPGLLTCPHPAQDPRHKNRPAHYRAYFSPVISLIDNLRLCPALLGLSIFPRGSSDALATEE